MEVQAPEKIVDDPRVLVVTVDTVEDFACRIY